MAIFYLLTQKDIAIKAITVVGTGESHCPVGLRNVLSAAIAYDNSIVSTSDKKLRVLLRPEEKSGTTVVDKKGNSIRVCTAVDKKRFEHILMNALKSTH